MENTDTFKIYYTLAPKSYDGFGTETVEMTDYFDQRGREVRKVKIFDKANNWQTMRYNSGMFGVFDQNEFNQLISMNYPTFKKKEEPKKEQQIQEENKTNMDKQEIQNPTIVNNKYIAQSESCVSVDTVTPESMRYDMLKAIETVNRRVNGVDEYVAEKLGYIVGNCTIEEKREGLKCLCDSFSAEQVDALAVAIYNIESKGQGCIIGDQTGIGKGRIAAGMIRYGMKRGLKPIFITEKVNLFSDIFRDLIAIGSDDAIPYKVLVGTKRVEKKSINADEDSKEDSEDLPQEDDADNEEEESEFVEVEVYEKNKYFPNKFVYVKKNEDDEEETITRIRKVSSVPFIMNLNDPKTNKQVHIKDEDGNILYSSDKKLISNVLGKMETTKEVIGTTKAGNPKYKKVFVQGSMQVPSECNFVLATYSQFSAGENSPKGDFLFNVAKNNIVIMDESHNASGNSNVGKFLKSVLEATLGVTFLSATFAKRPDNMPIYASKTSMADANMKDEELIGAIISGGVALQEIVSSSLVSEGQMIRRERSFEGIEVNYKYLDSTQNDLGKSEYNLQELHTAIMDRATEIIRDIIRFQKEYVDPIIESLDKEVKEAQGEVKKLKGTQQAGINNTPAFNGIFNLISQLLFSLKAEAVGKIAVERLNEGKKPIISFASTMESFLNELKNENDEYVKVGDIVDSDFGLVFEKRLKSTLRYKETNASGEAEYKYINPYSLDEKFLIEYKYILSKIKSTSIGICSSPIDVVIDVIKKAGYTVSEVTGRTRQFKILGNDKAQIKAKEQESPNDSFRRFNNNEVDVLLINQAGSTGASAHAIPTKKVSKDKVKQRVMIFLQSELNVNTEVQKRGRINRTGQILKPIYDYVVSSVPAEKRLMMMLQKKLKSLSANTTSSQKQQDEKNENIDKKSIDFLNKYGDKVIFEFLLENRIINNLIDDPLKINNSSNPEEVDYTDASQKVSGRIAILSIKDQNTFYTEIVERYISFIEYLVEIDEYDLEVKDLDLKAETLSKSISIVGKGGKSVFAKNTILEQCLVNNLKKPYKSKDVKTLIDASLNGLTPEQVQENLKKSFVSFIDSRLNNEILEYDRYFEDTIANTPKQKAILKIEDLDEREKAIREREKTMKEEMELTKSNLIKRTTIKKNDILSMFDFFYIGRAIYFPSTTYSVDREKFKGIFVGFAINENDRNPYAPSSMKLKFALQSSLRFVSVPASKFDIIAIIKDLTSSNYYYKVDYDTILERWDNETKEKSEDRTIRYIVTGNILQGFGKNDLKGNLVSYSTIDGKIKKGILLPELFVKGAGSSSETNVKVPIIKALPLIEKFERRSDSFETNGDLTITYGGMDYSNNSKYYVIDVPKNKQRGGQYYTDSKLIELSTSGTFNSSGQRMQCLIRYSNIQEAVQHLQDKFNLSVELRQYQYQMIESSIQIDDDDDDVNEIESEAFLSKLDEANRMEELNRIKEQEFLENQARLEREKNEQIIENKKSEVRSKLNQLLSLINNNMFAKGGNIDLKIYENIDELTMLYEVDNTWFAVGKKGSESSQGQGKTKTKALEDLELNLSYYDGGKYANGGEIYTHKHSKSWGESIEIELLEMTNKGWKVKQTIVKGKSKPKVKTAYFTKSEIQELFDKK
jgi:hypothetical protein